MSSALHRFIRYSGGGITYPDTNTVDPGDPAGFSHVVQEVVIALSLGSPWCGVTEIVDCACRPEYCRHRSSDPLGTATIATSVPVVDRSTAGIPRASGPQVRHDASAGVALEFGPDPAGVEGERLPRRAAEGEVGTVSLDEGGSRQHQQYN